MLENLGDWTWEVHADRWMTMFEKLQEHHKINGTTVVPMDDKTLGHGSTRNAPITEKGKLSADRIEKLNDLGDWSWDARN